MMYTDAQTERRRRRKRKRKKLKRILKMEEGRKGYTDREEQTDRQSHNTNRHMGDKHR